MTSGSGTWPAARALSELAQFPDHPKDEVANADEGTMLTRFVDYQRGVLARKAAGLSEEQARAATCPPSNLTMLGLVRHLAEVERGWANESFLGLDMEPLYVDEDDPDADWNPPADATLAEAIEAWWAQVAAADRIYAAASLDDICRRGVHADYSLRFILIHLVEEYARHCGQADLIREAIDGATGD